MTDKEDVSTPLDGFGLNTRLVDAVTKMGFESATPIQIAAIPHILEGRDIVGGARTGSGKTAAYGLPLLHKIDPSKRNVQALVLTPTRELALQVEAALRSYAIYLPIKTLAIYGGAPYAPQLRALSAGVHVVVGTPGRVIDHLERGTLNISALDILVLDEGDEMLRMGFIDDVERVLSKTPPTRQVALFSATMPPPIRRVANKYLNKPVEVQVETERLTVEHIEQRWMLVPGRHKVDALIRVLKAEPRGATLVFARTRKGCAEVADLLVKRGVTADALHGDLNQTTRERILGRFRNEQLDVIIATDVAARGIDIDHITHVINLDFPHDAEMYVHRIGRTGRAGRKGIALAFITPAERRSLTFLERRLKVRIAQVPVPSDARIAIAQRERLKDSLTEALHSESGEQARKWIAELVDAGTFTAEDIAVAALSQLAQQSGIHLEHIERDMPPMWARNLDDRGKRTWNKSERSEKRGKDHFREVNEVELHVPLGRNAGVRPADIVGALANELGISGKQVGRVTILASRTFVGVPKNVADLAFAKGAKLVIRGKNVEVTLSTDRPSPSKATRPTRSFNKKGKKDFKKRSTRK